MRNAVAISTMVAVCGLASGQVRFDLLATIDVSGAGLGNNVASVGWNGTDAYVGGIDNFSGTNVGLARIADALNAASITSFGSTGAAAGAGSEYMDVVGDTVYVAQTAAGPAGEVQIWDGVAGTFTSGIADNTQGGALEGIAADRRFGGRIDSTRRGRGFLFRDNLDGSAASDVGLDIGSFGYRGIDVDFDGNLFIRGDNGTFRVPTGDGTPGSGVYDSAGRVDLGGVATTGQYRNIAALDNTGFGDFVVFNERGTGSIESLLRVTDYDGNAVSFSISGLVDDSITGAYDFSYDRDSNTLAVSDFSNNSVYIFAVVPTPGAGALFAVAGLAATRRRR